MSYNSTKRRKKALHQARVGGKFVSSAVNSENPLTRVAQANQNLLSRLVNTETTQKDTAGEPMVNLKINDPFHKIYSLLKDIKAKQSATFSFKSTVPIMWLVVGLSIIGFGGFQFGRVQISCGQIVTTKIGVVTHISVLVPENSGLFQYIKNLIPQIPIPVSPAKLVAQQRTLLIDTSETITNIIHPSSLNLDRFENQKVLLTGTYSSCTGSMTLDAVENIRVY